MAEHSTLTGASLHENKGVDTAIVDTVATAQGGVTVWKKLGSDNITSPFNTFGTALLHVRDERTSGTAGSSASSGAWNVRTINTTKTNEIGASVASNSITLSAGAYWIEAQGTGSQVGQHRLRLRNTSDSTTTVLGINCATPNNFNSTAYMAQRFTIAGSKSFQVQHYTTNNGSFGTAFGGGDNEIYLDVRIWKIS